MRVVAMVPARLGSKRIKHKNLRLLGNKPLLQWVVDTARDSGLFDAVWVNSEASDIGLLAQRLRVPFYRRPQVLATDLATNDDFMADFMQNVAQLGGYTHVAQINPTSPFLSADDMRRALKLTAAGAATVISVCRLQAECRAYMREINYDPTRPMLPSQDLAPVHYFCNGIFVWEVDTWLRARQAHNGAAVYGPLGQTEYLELSGDSTIDLDTEDDWQAAEAIVRRRNEPATKARYWTPTLEQECDSMSCVRRDGISNTLGDPVQPHESSVASVTYVEHSIDPDARTGVCAPDSAFAWRVASSASFVATVIGQMPGEGNRLHYHPDCDELWYVLEGTFEFLIGDWRFKANKGDLVAGLRGVWHQITAVGDKRAVRLAVSKEGAAHVYSD